MLRADYLVLTIPITPTLEAALPVMQAMWLPDPRNWAMYGYRGFRSGKVFIGDNGERVLVQATGRIAHDVAMAMPLDSEHEMSVARIDVQLTFETYNADFLINSAQPGNPYKASRWVAVGEPGATLYVGAPSSDCRLRFYNKTAESGIRPPSGLEYARIELQFRNRYADRMFRAIRARAPHIPWLSHLRRMIDTYTYTLAADAIKSSQDELFPEEPVVEEDAIERRKRWIERSVIPAIRKVLAAEPEYIDILMRLLDNPFDGDDSLV